MAEIDLFYYAAKNKVRFKAPNVNGLITAEDAIGLSADVLRQIGSDLYAKSNENGGPFAKATAATARAKIEMQIIQYILDRKEEDAKRKADSATLRAERDRLLEVRDRKQNEALNSLDMAEIDKRLAALDALDAA